MEQLASIANRIAEPSGVLLLMIFMLAINSWVFKRLKAIPSDDSNTRRAISSSILLAGMLAIILTLPVDKTIKGQILSFLGIIISAGVALSSTTILGNLMAGAMNNSMNRFRNGDLIKIGDFHGRVTKKSIFHIEIQLEDSNFITIPNLYIASNPVKLIRRSNTVISASVSLGYDVSRIKIEESLKKAAISAGLQEPYVYITGLGDYSVTYKIHGFLDDSSKFFTTKSMLNAMVMDCLHENSIEIVSPSFTNRRQVNEKIFIPEREKQVQKPKQEDASPEELIFDEAIKSGEVEKKKDYLKKLDKDKDELKERLKSMKDEEDIKRIKSSIMRIEELRKKVEINIKQSIEKQKDKN